jgi:intracellular sulfur oxidation DsrE/DsrF family protein
MFLRGWVWGTILSILDELNLSTQWYGNVKKFIEVVNQIVVETIMHGKGIKLVGDDWPHIAKQKFYDGNYHWLDKNS